MTRRLADVEALLIGFLSDVDAGTSVPANLLDVLPFRAIYKLGGTAPHPKFLDRAQVQVSTYAATRESASDLAEVAREALFNAWRSQARTADGGIHKVVEVVSPFEIRTNTEPDGVFRFDATYQVWTRP